MSTSETHVAGEVSGTHSCPKVRDRARLRASLALALWTSWALLVQSGCAGGVIARYEPSGVVVLEVEPSHAIVVVDGERVGTVAQLGGELVLPEGVHRIELRAPGFMTHRVDFRVDPFAATALTVVLWPTLDESTAPP